MRPDRNECLIIGVGTEYGDDAFGLLVAREIALRSGENVTVIEQTGEGASLMESWQGYDNVIVIDCCTSNSDVGTRFRFDISQEKIPTKLFHYSTHAFGVAEAIETARALDRLPKRMIVLGVEGEKFEPGQPLNPFLELMVTEVADAVLAELRALLGQ